MTPRWCEIHFKPQPLLQKTYLFHASKTLATYTGACLHTHALAHVCRPLPMYVDRGPLWSFFSKIYFSSFKRLYFHFNTPQVNLISDWALNWPWALGFEHHWGREPESKGVQNAVSTDALFLFMSFVNGIKRIRDKTFCFDVWLRPNPRTRHTSCIHRAGCNSKELRGIRMSEVPPFLLGKRAMWGSLSQNLFCHLQENGEWLTILKSLKKKQKQNKQGCSYELTPQTPKGYSLCDVHLGLLSQTSPSKCQFRCFWKPISKD